ncbi:MAG: TolC family protein [Synergistales bacterium]|nr:TolC family protein [Synergistales bacterium]
MFRTRYLFFTVIVVLFITLTGITTYAGESLTLRDAIGIALERNLDILSARQEKIKAEGLLKIARGAFLPALSAAGEYTWQEETSTRPDETYGGDLSISQSIYMGGKLRAYRKQADQNLVIAESTITTTEEKVILDVYSRFYGLLLARENVRTAEDALTYAEDYANELREKREVGLATSLEVTRAEQLLLSSRQDLLEANNTLKSSRVSFLELLRIPPEEDLEIKGELNFLPVDIDAARSVALALEKRPELTNLRERILFQEQNIEIARAGLRPNVSVSGTWSYDDPANGGTDGDDTWSVKMKVDLPLYDNGITRGKVTQEEASLRQAQNALSSQEDSIKTEITNLFLDLGSAASRVEETSSNMELAMEALRLAEVGYREGVGIQLDVLDARRALTQARLSHSAAIKDHLLILASLRRAEGRLISYSLNGEDFKE